MSLIACPGASVSEPAQGAGLGDKLSQGTSVPLPTTLSICCPREPPPSLWVWTHYFSDSRNRALVSPIHVFIHSFHKPKVWIHCVLGI